MGLPIDPSTARKPRSPVLRSSATAEDGEERGKKNLPSISLGAVSPSTLPIDTLRAMSKSRMAQDREPVERALERLRVNPERVPCKSTG